MSVVSALNEAALAVRARTNQAPTVGVVLGSGLGAWAEQLENAQAIPYADVPHMPVSTVQGHAGKLWIGRSNGVTVACLQGRAHMYEGHEPERAVFGVRLLARLGARAMLITNAAGGLSPWFAPGDLMLIRDHLNLMFKNPLIGPNESELGPRFPDMTHAYDPTLGAELRAAALRLGVRLHEGVYAGLLGPTYETPAEIRMLRVLGADAVGMSTVPEAIALRHMRVPVTAVSCITNLAAGISPQELSHAEVEEAANLAKPRFVSLVSAWVERAAAFVAAQQTGEGAR
ncbi:MAG: purine-nucleoside phosphorylase [Polyangiaceae bacterium]|nr:purine-nucleoside phosphorylase [Polyangiaceae bacterium]